jgi:hypothetical protein
MLHPTWPLFSTWLMLSDANYRTYQKNRRDKYNQSWEKLPKMCETKKLGDRLFRCGPRLL